MYCRTKSTNVHSILEKISKKGIREGLYRPDLNIDIYVKFYYTLIFHINETTVSEREAQEIELEALEYHTRAMATEKGIAELEKQLEKS